MTVDLDANQIVVRTSNKKYFKRIDLPDLKRVDPPLSAPGCQRSACLRSSGDLSEMSRWLFRRIGDAAGNELSEFGLLKFSSQASKTVA